MTTNVYTNLDAFTCSIFQVQVIAHDNSQQIGGHWRRLPKHISNVAVRSVHNLINI